LLVTAMLVFTPAHRPTPVVVLPAEVQGAILDAQLRPFFDQLALDAYLATLAPPPPPATPSRNTGPHSDAWWRGVSVCEQGGRNDSFFGYFSIMDGSAGGLDWSTQVAMANAILVRAGHEYGTWAPSCVDAGYAASPGG
jgi:hypothetical protein